ncbi:MAG TPA: hypothetical protein VF596_00810 [Pyrinomonadaceae bacterium]
MRKDNRTIGLSIQLAGERIIKVALVGKFNAYIIVFLNSKLGFGKGAKFVNGY